MRSGFWRGVAEEIRLRPVALSAALLAAGWGLLASPAAAQPLQGRKTQRTRHEVRKRGSQDAAAHHGRTANGRSANKRPVIRHDPITHQVIRGEKAVARYDQMRTIWQRILADKAVRRSRRIERIYRQMQREQTRRTLEP